MKHRGLQTRRQLIHPNNFAAGKLYRENNGISEKKKSETRLGERENTLSVKAKGQRPHARLRKKRRRRVRGQVSQGS